MGFPIGVKLRQRHIWDFAAPEDADSSAATGTIAIFSIPADSVILDVKADVEVAMTGSTSEIVGDGGDPNGYLLDTFAATIQYVPVDNQSSPRGAYLFVSLAGATDPADVSLSAAQKRYTSADTIDFVIAGTATAGRIKFYIDFIRLS